jgi:hypothetical protein
VGECESEVGEGEGSVQIGHHTRIQHGIDVELLRDSDSWDMIFVIRDWVIQLMYKRKSIHTNDICPHLTAMSAADTGSAGRLFCRSRRATSVSYSSI